MLAISPAKRMLLFALTAAISWLHPPTCKAEVNGDCRGPTALQMTVLVSAFMLLVVGGGGIRPCNLAFGADQVDPKTQSGKRGIAGFFNWYFFTYTSAMIVSLTVIVCVQSNVSWSWGLAIPAILMFFSCLLFFAGERSYVKVKAEGSPLLSVAQVIVAAVRKRHLKVSHEAQLIGLSEAVTIVGFIEFYNKEFPENMRSFAGAANAAATALSSYLSTFLISIVHKFSEGHGDEDWLHHDLNKGKLDNFYYLVAALGAFNMCQVVQV